MVYIAYSLWGLYYHLCHSLYGAYRASSIPYASSTTYSAQKKTLDPSSQGACCTGTNSPLLEKRPRVSCTSTA